MRFCKEEPTKGIQTIVQRTAFVLSFTLFILLMAVFSSAAEVTAETNTQDVPTVPSTIWVEPLDANGIPARIDLFKETASETAGETTDTYQLFLPGNAVVGECFLSWEGDAQAIVEDAIYESGACPVPPADTEMTYSFISGDEVLGTLAVKSYQGSAGVQPLFIDIDESQGTIEAMDSDVDHNTSCRGRINIGGQWYEMSKIKGRGNATWRAADDKRPYNITLKSKINFPGIDSGTTKKWTLLAEIYDHSLLRNRVGFYLACELGVGQDATSADVWMNGEYQGCYTVTPKNDSFVSKDGYMIEEDNYKETVSVENGGNPQFELEGLKGNTSSVSGYNLITVKKIGDNLLLKDGVPDESPSNQEAVSATIHAWLQDAWDAIRSDDGYNDKGKYYTEYVDMESFANMYLMREYVKNYDEPAGSIFFHRDGQSEGDKLIAGPMWDLDNSMGSVLESQPLGDLRSGRGAFITEVDESFRTSIYKTLGRHEDFMEEVRNQYLTHQSAFDNLYLIVDQMREEMEDSAIMNHIKVKDLSVNGHRYRAETILAPGTEYEQVMLATTDSKTDWANYVSNLKTFISARSLWLRNNDFKPCIHEQTNTTTTCATLSANGEITKKCDVCGSRVETTVIYAPKTFNLSATTYTYNGSVLRPSVTVIDSAGNTIAASNYTVDYTNNINAGTATARVTFQGEQYDGSKNLTFTINKAANSLSVKGRTAIVKRKVVRKKAQTLAIAKAVSFTSRGQGGMAYKKMSGNKKITISNTTGSIRVKKGLKKGTYKVKAQIRAAGNSNYKASTWKTVLFKIKVK